MSCAKVGCPGEGPVLRAGMRDLFPDGGGGGGAGRDAPTPGLEDLTPEDMGTVCAGGRCVAPAAVPALAGRICEAGGAGGGGGGEIGRRFSSVIFQSQVS